MSEADRVSPEVEDLNASTSEAQSAVLTRPIAERLHALIVDSPMRFTWFSCNVVVVLNSMLYILPWRYTGLLKEIWYRLVLLGATGTFSIVVYQNLGVYKSPNGPLKKHALLSDDNVHYLYDALIWLFLPRHLFAIVPFLSFSFFHVLNFISSDLFPALNISKGVSAKIHSFTKQYHELSRREAAASELLLLIQLVFQAALFRRWSWISLVAYAIFIKVKSEGSVFTRNVLKSWEVRVDGVVSNQSVPPIVKSQWGSFKRLLKTLDKLNLIQKVEQKIS